MIIKYNQPYAFFKLAVLISILFLSVPAFATVQDNPTWEDMGLNGGQINKIALDPEDRSTLYAGSWMGDGLFKSFDAGMTWLTIPGFRNWEVFDISIDTNNPSNIWIANSQYIDVSYNYGDTWETLNPVGNEDRFCYSIEVDSHDPSGNTVYVGTSGPGWLYKYGAIFKTTDGGKTWFKSKAAAMYDVLDIRINPNHPGEIWAVSSPYNAAENEGLVYVSTNSGTTWSNLTSGQYLNEGLSNLGYLARVLIHPTNPLRIFACGTHGVFSKPDGPNRKTNWYLTEMIHPSWAMCIPHSEPDTIYAAIKNNNSENYEVTKSTDAGKIWDEFSAAPDDFIAMEADPLNSDIIYAGGVNRGIFKTSDGAQSWQSINNGIKANSIFSTDPSPDNSSSIICGTLSGVYLAADRNGWKLLNELISYSVLFHPDKKEVIYAGFDSKIGKSTDNGITWSYLEVSDSTDSHGVQSIAVSHLNPNTVFAGIEFSSGKRGEIIKITDDDSKDFSEVLFKSVLVADAPVNTIVIHPDNPDIIFAGTGTFYTIYNPGRIYCSRDGGNTWSQTQITDVVVNSISISPTNPDIIYAGCGDSGNVYSGIFKSTDSGNTWESRIRGLPKEFAISDIQVDKSDSNIVYAALFSGLDAEDNNLAGLYLTLDGGDYWTQIGLSDYQLYDVCSFISSSAETLNRTVSGSKSKISFPLSTILAGTGSGLFRTTTAGTGVITGSIISDTGGMIDQAVVSSINGENAISVEGYYLLMVPAGVHTLQVQCPGYIQTTAPAVTVSAGQSSTQNIIITKSEQDNSTTCLADNILRKASRKKELAILRNFRDSVLAKTSPGNKFISLYYALGEDVWKVLDNSPSLKKRCMKLMLKAISIVKISLSGKNPRISLAYFNKVDAFLVDLEQASPPELKKRLNSLRRDIKSFDFSGMLTSKQ